MTSKLHFNCPHCKHQYQDDWEVLSSGTTHEFRCENCTKPFVLLINECLVCTAESVFIWKEIPNNDVFQLVICESCGAQKNSDCHEDISD